MRGVLATDFRGPELSFQACLLLPTLTLSEGRDFFFLNPTCKMGVVLWDREGSVSLNLVEVVEMNPAEQGLPVPR